MAKIRQLLCIAGVTVRELLHNYIMHGLLAFFAIVLLLIKFIIPMAPGSEEALAEDIGLMLISGVLTFLVIIVVAWYVPRDQENKTIYALLSSPISRGGMFFGKYLGIMTVILWGGLLMGLLLQGYLFALFHSYHLDIFYAVLLIVLSNLILLAITMMSSTFLSSFVNILFALLVYILGLYHPYVEHLIDRSVSSPDVQAFLYTGLGAFPNLAPLYVRDKLVVGYPLIWDAGLISACQTSGIYMGLYLLLGCVFFYHKDF